MRLPLCFVRQFAQIQAISIGGIVGESHIRSLFVPYRHISLHQHRAGPNAPHRQHVCQKSLHCDPPATRILQTGFFSSPERTNPAAYARVILRVHLSLGPERHTDPGASKLFCLYLGLDAVAGIPFIAWGSAQIRDRRVTT
jgi:hypothetical protein